MTAPTPWLRPVDRRRWLTRSSAALVLVAGGGAVAQSAPGAQAGTGPAQRGERVAWPEVPLLDGPVRPAAHWQGRAVVVVFFTTTCGYCMRHNRHIDRLVQQTAHLPLSVLGAVADADAPAARRYMAAGGHRFDVTLASDALHRALSARRSVPLTCVVDRTGVLREVIPGEMFEADVLELARWARA